jgi:hypothetical protein
MQKRAAKQVKETTAITPISHSDDEDFRRGGTFLKFVDKVWSANGVELPAGTQLIADETGVVVDHWGLDGKVKTYREEPLPDVDAENDKVPQSKWPRDKSGNLRPPLRKCVFVKLINPKTYETFEFKSGTAGAWRGFRTLRQCMDSQLKMDGVAAMPIVELQWQWMPTRHGKDVPAPHFTIVGWWRPGDGKPAPMIEGPKTPGTQATPTAGKNPSDPTDEIPWLG